MVFSTFFHGDTNNRIKQVYLAKKTFDPDRQYLDLADEMKGFADEMKSFTDGIKGLASGMTGMDPGIGLQNSFGL